MMRFDRAPVLSPLAAGTIIEAAGERFMDGFVARGDLIAADRLKALSARSDRRGLERLALHGTALAIGAAAIEAAWGTPWLAPALAVQGVVLIFLFAALHETIHRTAFHARWLNDALAWIAGMVLILPPHYFRLFHFAHHRFTQDAALDPELSGPKPATRCALLLYASGWPYWREAVTTTLRHARGQVAEAFVPGHERGAVVREARFLLACYAAVALAAWAAGSWAPVVHWAIPVLIGQPALRLFLLAEHTGCAMVPDMLANTRTTLSNPVVRAVTWNMTYHAEHHLFPGVPFHALPALHALVRDRLAVVATGYGAFHRDLWRAARRAA
jgi:fatty acid desaturase